MKLVFLIDILHFECYIGLDELQDKSKLKILQVKTALKFSKSWKQFKMTSILPKNEGWDNFVYWKLSQRSFLEELRTHNMLSRLCDL